MKTSNLYHRSYLEEPGQVMKKYVFLFIRRNASGDRRDYHIIWSSCPDNAYDMFFNYCEQHQWKDVNVISFSRIIDGFKPNNDQKYIPGGKRYGSSL